MLHSFTLRGLTGAVQRRRWRRRRRRHRDDTNHQTNELQGKIGLLSKQLVEGWDEQKNLYINTFCLYLWFVITGLRSSRFAQPGLCRSRRRSSSRQRRTCPSSRSCPDIYQLLWTIDFIHPQSICYLQLLGILKKNHFIAIHFCQKREVCKNETLTSIIRSPTASSSSSKRSMSPVLFASKAHCPAVSFRFLHLCK